MPYTPSVVAYLEHLAHMESKMLIKVRVTDPTINANYGIIPATNAAAALDIVARRMGWNSYDEYTAAAAKHSGTRTLKAVELNAASSL